MKRTALIAFLVVASLVLASCGQEDDMGAGNPLGDRTWVLTSGSVDGVSLQPIPGHAVTLRVDDGTVAGTAACNHYGGPVFLDGSEVSIGEGEGLARTEMWCEATGVMDLEAAFLDALVRVQQVIASGGGVLLTGDGVELRFEPEPSAVDASLTGTHWTLDTLVDGDSTSTPAASAWIVFTEDGAVSGHDGCNGFGGSYDPVLGFTEIVATLIACDEAIMNQERLMLGVLSGPAHVSIAGDSLTITHPSGKALRLLAVEPDEVAALAGIEWNLEMLVDGEVATAPVAPAFLLFDADGSFTGSSGCNQISGTLDDDLGFGPTTATEMACGEEIMAQEAFVLTVLGQGADLDIDGETLTIRGPAGKNLQYRAG